MTDLNWTKGFDLSTNNRVSLNPIKEEYEIEHENKKNQIHR